MDEISVIQFVPDGPEIFLSIPGPLGVALRLVDSFPNSLIVTSSTDTKKNLSDARISFSKIKIYKKHQYRKRLATGFSRGFILRYLQTPIGPIKHLHYSRSISTALISLISLVKNNSLLVVQMHGSVKFEKKFFKRVFDYLFTRRIMRSADVIVALQENEKEHLERIGAEKSKIVVIPNFSIPLSDIEKEKLSRKYSSRPQVLFVGHLRPSKQVHRFFEIALLEKFSHCNFVIAGPDGGELKKLLQDIDLSNRNNIKYLGSLDWNKLSKVYCESDIILSPALDAPFDLSFIDGVARGCLGIASKEFNNWQQLDSIGVLIAEDTGIDKLATELDNALDMIKKGTKTPRDLNVAAEEIYGQKVISKRWDNLYREIGQF